MRMIGRHVKLEALLHHAAHSIDIDHLYFLYSSNTNTSSVHDPIISSLTHMHHPVCVVLWRVGTCIRTLLCPVGRLLLRTHVHVHVQHLVKNGWQLLAKPIFQMTQTHDECIRTSKIFIRNYSTCRLFCQQHHLIFIFSVYIYCHRLNGRRDRSICAHFVRSCTFYFVLAFIPTSSGMYILPRAARLMIVGTYFGPSN